MMRKNTAYEPIQADSPANIARYAKTSITIIWMGGLMCLMGILSLMLAGSNRYLLVDWMKGNAANPAQTNQWQTADSLHRMFENKTALVNVGLKAASGNFDDAALQPNGSIQISKIYHDQKLQAQKTTDRSFVIKAVPK